MPEKRLQRTREAYAEKRRKVLLLPGAITVMQKPYQFGDAALDPVVVELYPWFSLTVPRHDAHLGARREAE